MNRAAKAALAAAVPTAAVLQFYDYAFARTAPGWIRAIRRRFPGTNHCGLYYLQRDASTAAAEPSFMTTCGRRLRSKPCGTSR